MSLHRKVAGLIGLAVALSLCAFLATEGLAGGSSCGGKKAQASSCPSAAKGCAGAAMSGCGTKATQTASGCCAAKNSAGAQAANVVLPEGTQMTRADVDGGIDLVFTGKDLAGIETFLNAHMAMCTDAAKAGNTSKAGSKELKSCGQTCTVARHEQNVVLSIRGKEAEACCTTWVQQAALTDEAKPNVVPASGSRATGLKAVKKG